MAAAANPKTKPVWGCSARVVPVLDATSVQPVLSSSGPHVCVCVYVWKYIPPYSSETPFRDLKLDP